MSAVDKIHEKAAAHRGPAPACVRLLVPPQRPVPPDYNDFGGFVGHCVFDRLIIEKPGIFQ
jgi:hypothetical protein